MLRKISIALVAAGVMAVPALAAENLTIKIDYTPEQLRTEDGARSVYSDIAKAAEAVCEQTSTTARLRYMLASSKCETEAIDTAIAEIGSPLLSAVHHDATG